MTKLNTVSIPGEEVDVGGVHLDNRLDWKCNTDVYRKGQSRLYLRKLRSFNIYSKMLHIFYQSVVASALFCTGICWDSSIRARKATPRN